MAANNQGQSSMLCSKACTGAGLGMREQSGGRMHTAQLHARQPQLPQAEALHGAAWGSTRLPGKQRRHARLPASPCPCSMQSG